MDFDWRTNISVAMYGMFWLFVSSTVICILLLLGRFAYVRLAKLALWQIGVMLALFMLVSGVAYGFWQPYHHAMMTY